MVTSYGRFSIFWVPFCPRLWMRDINPSQPRQCVCVDSIISFNFYRFYWFWSILIKIDQYLININQYWSISINIDPYLINLDNYLINHDQYSSILIHIDQYLINIDEYEYLINIDKYWHILINIDQYWSIFDQYWSIINQYWSISINIGQYW